MIIIQIGKNCNREMNKCKYFCNTKDVNRFRQMERETNMEMQEEN